MIFDELDFSATRSSFGIDTEERDYSLESAWLEWLEENDCEYPLLANELDVELPRLLPVLVPVVGSMGIRTALWCFYMDVELRFLCSLPNYKRTASTLTAIDGCLIAGDGVKRSDDYPSYEEISIYVSKVLSNVMDSKLLMDDCNWWSCCAILEQLDLWPRDAVDWMIWLTKVCHFVQSEANGQRLRLSLEMLQQKIEENSFEDSLFLDESIDTTRQRKYLQSVVVSIQKFIDECSWSMPYFSEISVKDNSCECTD